MLSKREDSSRKSGYRKVAASGPEVRFEDISAVPDLAGLNRIDADNAESTLRVPHVERMSPFNRNVSPYCNNSDFSARDGLIRRQAGFESVERRDPLAAWV
jgi:hypothetical protein